MADSRALLVGLEKHKAVALFQGVTFWIVVPVETRYSPGPRPLGQWVRVPYFMANHLG
jgi:hypothetical protein